MYFFFSVRLERTLNVRFCVLLKNSGSRALFIGPASTEFSKKTFKTGFHSTIHTFKNYSVIVFSVFNNKWYPNRSLMFLNLKTLKKCNFINNLPTLHWECDIIIDKAAILFLRKPLIPKHHWSGPKGSNWTKWTTMDRNGPN